MTTPCTPTPTDRADLIEHIARKIIADTRHGFDPDELTPLARGHSGLVPKWRIYEHIATSVAELVVAERTNSAVICDVAEMKTSAGSDYYVRLRMDGREITPHMFKIRGWADYEVAEWKWFFGQGEKPDLMAFDTDAPALSPEEEIREKHRRCGCKHCDCGLLPSRYAAASAPHNRSEDKSS